MVVCLFPLLEEPGIEGRCAGLISALRSGPRRAEQGTRAIWLPQQSRFELRRRLNRFACAQQNLAKHFVRRFDE